VPELTVLMPAYNERATIERTIDDVLDAELGADGTELVVVDDGSTDGTPDVLRARPWPDNATFLRHERNLGKGAAIRTGLAHASGTYATVLDANLECAAARVRDRARDHRSAAPPRCPDLRCR
jgi:glycosyltransferase involved in cell wall biosynthesis